MRKIMVIGIAFGSVLLGLSRAQGANETFSWAGSYEGFVVCDDVTNGAFPTFARPVTARVAQTGTAIDFELSAVVDADAGVTSTAYRGEVMENAGGDVSTGYVESCSGDFPHTELARFFPASTVSEGFAFTADTIFVSRNVPGVMGKLVVESCRWSLKRISTQTPSVRGC